MKGDFSRIRFNPANNYTAVLEQQGRVALDADANEQCAIDEYLGATETIDVVGRYGAPVHDSGFMITVQNNEISIGAGRYYVDGLLCKNPEPVNYEAQPFLLGAVSSAALLQQLTTAGSTATIQVSLQAWQRLVTALDDPCLREPALGQADTTARLQTVCRVVASLVASGPASENTVAAAPPLPVAYMTPCCQAMYTVEPAQHDGTMAAQTSGAADTCGCQPIAAAGYRGLENQLYRVEIHQGGKIAQTTFKWSRENGSVVVAIVNISGPDVTVASLGPDANLGFQVGQWVEISDDTYLFGNSPNQPGKLYQIQQIVGLTVTMTTPVSPVVDRGLNARMRRWDQSGLGATDNGIALPSSASWIDLENGIQVQFGAGEYVSGDYWLIPARAASGQIEWPPCGSDGQQFQRPHYAELHRAPLACIHYVPESENTPASFSVDDCRIPFSPLTELTQPSAMHVTKINWINDDVMTLDTLVKNGLEVTFDQAPDGPVTPANFVVTLETTNMDPGFATLPGPSSGNVLSTALYNPTIIDSVIDLYAAVKTLRWSMPPQPGSQLAIVSINRQLDGGVRYGRLGRARVKAFGSTMFTTSASGRMFLDGQAFGQPGQHANGTPRIDLQLPSGNAQKASDFESWFYLYPTLEAALLQVTYTDLTVKIQGGRVTVTAYLPTTAPPNPNALQQATITLNYPAMAATHIDLALTSTPAVTGIVALPQPPQVAVGQSSVPVTLALTGVPTAVTTFTLTASIPNAVGIPPLHGSATFIIRPG